MQEERKAIGSDIKDIFAEAKAAGFDPRIMRVVLKVRASDPEQVAEVDALRDAYLHALDTGEMIQTEGDEL